MLSAALVYTISYNFFKAQTAVHYMDRALKYKNPKLDKKKCL